MEEGRILLAIEGRESLPDTIHDLATGREEEGRRKGEEKKRRLLKEISEVQN